MRYFRFKSRLNFVKCYTILPIKCNSNIHSGIRTCTHAKSMSPSFHLYRMCVAYGTCCQSFEPPNIYWPCRYQNQFEKNCPCNYEDLFISVDKLKSRLVVLGVCVCVLCMSVQCTHRIATLRASTMMSVSISMHRQDVQNSI